MSKNKKVCNYPNNGLKIEENYLNVIIKYLKKKKKRLKKYMYLMMIMIMKVMPKKHLLQNMEKKLEEILCLKLMKRREKKEKK